MTESEIGIPRRRSNTSLRKELRGSPYCSRLPSKPFWSNRNSERLWIFSTVSLALRTAGSASRESSANLSKYFSRSRSGYSSLAMSRAPRARGIGSRAASIVNSRRKLSFIRLPRIEHTTIPLHRTVIPDALRYSRATWVALLGHVVVQLGVALGTLAADC